MKVSTIGTYLVARIEVTCARLTGKLRGGGSPSPDRLPAFEIPSVARGDVRDRTLAEIDQEGFLFACDPRDIVFFNRRPQRVARHHRPLLIVLRDGVVCVEIYPPYKRDGGIRDCIFRALGWEFYLEAAALLRLQGLTFIPGLLDVHTRERIIRLEFIWGETLYRSIGQGQLQYEDIQRSFAAMIQDPRSSTATEVACILKKTAERGVTQLDIHAANFIRGEYTKALYMVDLHLVRLGRTA